jgi:hypothetical protein
LFACWALQVRGSRESQLQALELLAERMGISSEAVNEIREKCLTGAEGIIRWRDIQARDYEKCQVCMCACVSL